MIDLVAGLELPECHFHEHNRRLVAGELFLGAGEDGFGEVGDRAKTAALDEDRLLVEQLGRLDDFASRGEHHGFGETLLDELQRHQPVVHAGKAGTAETNHVHLDAFVREAVEH